VQDNNKHAKHWRIKTLTQDDNEHAEEESDDVRDERLDAERARLDKLVALLEFKLTLQVMVRAQLGDNGFVNTCV